MNRQLVNDAFNYTDIKTQEAKDYADSVAGGGSSDLVTRTITADTTIAETDDIIVCDNSANAINITLPDATTLKKKRYTIFSLSNNYMVQLSTTGTNPKKYVINQANYAITVFPNGSDADDWILLGDNSNEHMTQDVLDGLFLYNKFESMIQTGAGVYPSDVGEDLQLNNGGPTLDSNGVVGNCALFDGVDDYLIANHNSNQVNANAYDFLFWVKLPSGVAETPIIHKAGAYENISYMGSGNGTPYLRAYWHTASGNKYFDTGGGTLPNIEDDNWHMIRIRATADGTQMITKFYVDNALITGTTDTQQTTYLFNTTSTDPLYVGYAPNTGKYINGSIDILRMYNRILTDDEINKIYNAGNGLQG